jgi:hypothetical protein
VGHQDKARRGGCSGEVSRTTTPSARVWKRRVIFQIAARFQTSRNINRAYKGAVSRRPLEAESKLCLQLTMQIALAGNIAEGCH